MADSEAFEQACAELERSGNLDRLAARGTIRIALKLAGLCASNVGAHSMRVVTETILPAELEARGVDSPEAVCRSIRARLAVLHDEEPDETPEAIFSRLGGDE